MWRKTEEGKPSSPAAETPTPAPAIPNVTAQAQPKASSAPPIQAPATMPVPVRADASAIAPGLKINGEIGGSTDLFIDGEVQGKIRMGQSKVTVGPNGRVHADIEAREITVEGNVQGNLKATERVQLGARCRVEGSILSPRLGIEEGARLRGKVEMAKPGESRRESGGTRAAEAEPAQTVSARASKD